MPTIRIPRPLRPHAGGRAQVDVDGSDVRSVLDALVRAHPGLEDRLLDPDGQLRRFVNVFVGDDDIRHREGLDTAVADSDTITLVPAVAGGADRGRPGDRGSTHRADRVAGGADRGRPGDRGSTHRADRVAGGA